MLSVHFLCTHRTEKAVAARYKPRIDRGRHRDSGQKHDRYAYLRYRYAAVHENKASARTHAHMSERLHTKNKRRRKALISRGGTLYRHTPPPSTHTQLYWIPEPVYAADTQQEFSSLSLYRSPVPPMKDIHSQSPHIDAGAQRKQPCQCSHPHGIHAA